MAIAMIGVIAVMVAGTIGGSFERIGAGFFADIGRIQLIGIAQAATDSTAPVAEVRHPTVASLTPAAEDLICSIGAGAHLVGVSNYDATPAAAGLPRVGDYQTVDWEKLSALHPDILIVQIAPDRMPAGLQQRAASLGARVVNIQIETLTDIHREMLRLGDELGESAGAAAAARAMQNRLDQTRQVCAGAPKVRTLLVRDADSLAVIGPRTFLDELLTIAGGTNVLAAGTPRYPSIDRETLASLAPDAVILVLPGASPQVIQSGRRYWAAMPEVPAVRQGRVFVIDDPRAQIPGAAVADIAQKLAEDLHPELMASAASRSTSSRAMGPQSAVSPVAGTQP
jgi:iron complex transport system substrate-binding protein